MEGAKNIEKEVKIKLSFILKIGALTEKCALVYETVCLWADSHGYSQTEEAHFRLLSPSLQLWGMQMTMGHHRWWGVPRRQICNTVSTTHPRSSFRAGHIEAYSIRKVVSSTPTTREWLASHMAASSKCPLFLPSVMWSEALASAGNRGTAGCRSTPAWLKVFTTTRVCPSAADGRETLVCLWLSIQSRSQQNGC